MKQDKPTYEELLKFNKELRLQLEEATNALDAVRNGLVDALVVNTDDGPKLYTLKTADQSYRTFIEKMNEGAVTINRDGLVIYCNSKFATMVGMPMEKILSVPFADFIAPVSKEKYETLAGNAWEEECKDEIELRKANGQPISCLLSCNTLELDGGLALILILADLTLLKDTENQLRIRNLQLAAAHETTEKLNNELEDQVKARTSELYLSREHFKYLANNIPQMTWTNLPDGQLEYYSEQWYDYTGFDHEQSLEDVWSKVIHADDLQATNEKFKNALKTGEVFEMENRYRRASDGSFRWHLNRAVPLKNEHGDIFFWVGTATDIEDQKKEMEKRDEFIGIASHELKTPLTSLKGYLQLITATRKEDITPKTAQYLQKADKALRKLQTLINDLLDVSKIQAGKLEYSVEEMNVAELVRTCVENAQHIYPDNVFEIQDGNEYIVNGNAERLEQVLMNLISNAVKYSHEDKKVIVKTEKRGDCVRVSVTDLGIGLSDDQKEKIFERFYRVEDRKYLTSGLGMGLYISAEIIHNHRGEIGVESELGKGSTFYFELPLVEVKG